jgi:hypothetical protein
MSKITSLFKDDNSSRNERIHYSWLRRDYFPEPEYIVYPNAALQVIIDPEFSAIKEELVEETEWIDSLQIQWSPRNFFYNSSVDLCVIRTSDYLPFVAFEIDGESHAELGRKEQDELKNLFFAKAGIPLIRLRVYREQSETLKRKHLAEAVSQLNRQYRGSVDPAKEIQGKRRVLYSDQEREYFELLSRTFSGEEYVVFPNVALQSIFTNKIRLTEYRERDVRQRGLVDFCVFGATDLRPKVAFSLSKDELRERVFNFFGLPLLDLHSCLGTRDPIAPEDAVVRIQKSVRDVLNCAESTSNSEGDF